MIITCHKRMLRERCVQRNYKIEDVMPCVLAQDDDIWTIDTAHPAYPAITKPIELPDEYLKRPEHSGVGTELKKLLAGWPFYITATPDCPCNRRARTMNENGIEWCEQNIDTIVGWLHEEAEKRGLPFLNSGAKLLVRRAIHNAKKQQAKNG